MWLIDSNGSTFGGKRIILQSGFNYFFGRVLSNPNRSQDTRDRYYYVDDKSVSRLHLLLQIQSSSPSNDPVSHMSIKTDFPVTYLIQQGLPSNSHVLITDTSKTGTRLDGCRFVGSKRKLTNGEHIISLGTSSQTFRINWLQLYLAVPVSHKTSASGITDHVFSTISKQLRARLNINCSHQFIPGESTHLIYDQCFAPVVFQALISGAYIVSSKFLLSIASQVSDGEKLCNLTEDFERFWPKPIDYLPRELDRFNYPRQLFLPDPQRCQLFDGLTFIFFDECQSQTFSPVYQLAHGKAYLFPTTQGKTRGQDILPFVKMVYQKQNLHNELPSFIRNSLVLVSPPQAREPWLAKLINEVTSVLHCSTFSQETHLLEVILTKNTVKLVDVDHALYEAFDPFEPPVKLEELTDSTATNDDVIKLKSRNSKEQSHNPLYPINNAYNLYISEKKAPKSDITANETVPVKTLSENVSGNLIIPAKDEQILIGDDEELGNMNYSAKYVKSFNASSNTKSDKSELVNSGISKFAKPPQLSVKEFLAQTSAIKPYVQNCLSTTLPRGFRSINDINISAIIKAQTEAENEVARRDEESLREAMRNFKVEEVQKSIRYEEMPVRAPSGRLKGMNRSVDNSSDMPGVNELDRDGSHVTKTRQVNFKGFQRKGNKGIHGALPGRSRVIVELVEAESIQGEDLTEIDEFKENWDERRQLEKDFMIKSDGKKRCYEQNEEKYKKTKRARCKEMSKADNLESGLIKKRKLEDERQDEMGNENKKRGKNLRQTNLQTFISKKEDIAKVNETVFDANERKSFDGIFVEDSENSEKVSEQNRQTQRSPVSNSIIAPNWGEDDNSSEEELKFRFKR